MSRITFEKKINSSRTKSKIIKNQMSKNLKNISAKVNHLSRIFRPRKAILEVKPNQKLDYDFQYFKIFNQKIVPSKLVQPLILPFKEMPTIEQIEDNKFEVNTNGSVPAFYAKAISDFHPHLVSCQVENLDLGKDNTLPLLTKSETKKLWKKLSSFQEPKLTLKCIETPNYYTVTKNKDDIRDRRWMFFDQAPTNSNSRQFLRESKKYTTLNLAPLANYQGGLELISQNGFGIFHLPKKDSKTECNIVKGSGYDNNPQITDYHIKMNRIHNAYYYNSSQMESGKFLPRFPTIYNSSQCHYVDLVHLYLMILKEGGKAELTIE